MCLARRSALLLSTGANTLTAHDGRPEGVWNPLQRQENGQAAQRVAAFFRVGFVRPVLPGACLPCPVSMTLRPSLPCTGHNLMRAHSGAGRGVWGVQH